MADGKPFADYKDKQEHLHSLDSFNTTSGREFNKPINVLLTSRKAVMLIGHNILYS